MLAEAMVIMVIGVTAVAKVTIGYLMKTYDMC